MYGILGEADSDTQTLKVLVKRLADNPSLTVKLKSFGGCAELLRRGAMHLQLFRRLSLARFIVCHDADGPDPKPNHDLVMRRIVQPSGLGKECCIVIPVQELEAWILADIECASKVFSSWKPSPIKNPEGISKPKEHIERLSREGKQRPRYRHEIHNEKMALHLDLEKVAEKCPAFRTLVAFVKSPGPRCC